MKNSVLLIRSSKIRKHSAHGPRTKPVHKDRPRTTLSVQDLNPDSQPADSLQHHIHTFSQHELNRLDVTLDSLEISQQNRSPVPLESFSKLLKDFSVCLKSKDFHNSNRLLRLAFIFEKSLKSAKSQIAQPEVLNVNKAKTGFKRENFTQTVSGDKEEVLEFADTSTEIEFIRELIGKFDKLRGPKIMNRLVDLHEHLSKVHNDFPSPVDTPEPFESNLTSHGQQLSIFIKVLKTEIRNLLSRSNVELLKLDKAAQVDLEKKNEADIIKEKAQELISLKKQLEHKDKELEVLKDNLAKCRGSLVLSERKLETVSLELIQITNKFRSSEDQLKAVKSKLSYLSDYFTIKKEKKKKLKRQMKANEKALVKAAEHIKSLKDSVYGSTIEGKIAQEKLGQIEEAWKKLFFEEFDYKNVTTIEIASKYSIFKPVGEECLSPDEIVSIKNSDQICRRSNTVRADGRLSGFVSSKISPMPTHEKKPENCAEIQSLVSEEYSLSPNPEEVLQPRSRKDSENFVETKQKHPEHYFSKQENRLKPSEFLKSAEFPQEKPQIPRQPYEPSPRRRESFQQIQPKDQHRRRLSAITTENLTNSLSTIIEASPIGNIPIETFSKFSIFPQNIEVEESSPDSPIQPLQQRRKGYEKLSINMNSTPESQAEHIESFSRTPLLQCLINEKESIYRSSHNKTLDKPSKPEQRSQEVQCSLLVDSPTKRRQNSPTKTRKTNLISKELDESTLENLRKLTQETGGLKDSEDIDCLPPAIQVEIIKCFEGHDSKRCEKFCIHLKRALAVRNKYRGVPYPIKTVFFNSQID